MPCDSYRRHAVASWQDSDGNTYVYGLDLIMRFDGTDEEWHLSDGLGSTIALAGDNGDVTDEYAYDVFGAERSHTGSSGAEFTFAGEQTDASGLQYLRARYYDPANGRFLSQDQIPFLQQYAYVGNNPVNFVDPSGLTGVSFDGIGAITQQILDSACWTSPTGCKKYLDMVDDFFKKVADTSWQKLQSAGNAMLRSAVFAVADAVYAPFYFGYYGARLVGSAPVSLRIQLLPILPILWVSQGVGLVLDNAMDRFKTRYLGTKEGTKDDNACNFVMGSTIGAWVDEKTGFGPEAWFPGRGEHGTKFAWGLSERPLDFSGCPSLY